MIISFIHVALMFDSVVIFVRCMEKLNASLFQPFHSQDLISNSPYYLTYNSYDVSSENLVLDQLIIP